MYNWVALKDTHGGALVHAKECIKRLNKRWTWKGTLCCTWSFAQDFTLRRTEKRKKKCEEKDAFEVSVDGPLEGAIKGALEGTPKGALKDALSDLHIDV